MAEALLKIAVIKDYERELEELENDTTPVYFSDAHKSRMQRMFRYARFRRMTKKIWQVTYKSAAVLVIIFVMFSSLLMFNTTVRAAVEQVVIEWFESFTEFDFKGDSSGTANSEWHLGFVPDGYVKQRSLFEFGTIDMNYKSADGKTLRFTAYPLGSGTIGVDNENAEYKIESIRGVDYYVFEGEDDLYPTRVLWGGDEYEFYLSSGLNAETLLKVAQSVEFTSN
jgi:hypothetical protein